MKKVINNSEDIITEALEGFLMSHGNLYKKVKNVNGIALKEKKNKVAILVGGGSGHEPLYTGFVGEGLADGASIGNVFAAPTPYNVLEVTKNIDAGKGVLFLYGNYAGDILNFDMAAELAEMEGINCETVLVKDDVASASKEKYYDRRGIAGAVFAIKIAGAAANFGLSLREVKRITEKAVNSTKSIGIALSPGTIPGLEKPIFDLGDNEIEFGMGIHGEPGIERVEMMKADDITEKMLSYIFNEYQYGKEEVCVLVNGLGSTTQLELMIVNRKVNQLLKEKKIKVYDNKVGSYCTSLEMGGFSISLLSLDDELKKFYDMPANSPYFYKL